MDPNGDARRGLGIRPGNPPGLPPIFSQGYNLADIAPYSSPKGPDISREPSPTSENQRDAKRDFSLPVPAISREPVGSNSPRSPSVGNFQRRLTRVAISRPRPTPTSATRGVYETQKLLAHLLDRLDQRLIPPDLLEQAARKAKDAAHVGKSKEKAKVVQLGHAVVAAAQSGLHVGQHNAVAGPSKWAGLPDGISSEDVANESAPDGSWDTEETFLLVDQMRDLLILASKQELDLFASSQHSPTSPTSPITPARNKRLAGRFSLASPTSPIRNRFANAVEQSSPVMSGSALRRRLIAILRTLFSHDCLYATVNFRLLCPPRALQLACLDLASLLFDQADEAVEVEIMEMVICAMSSLDESLIERVCTWLAGRLGGMLQRLSQQRGGGGLNNSARDEAVPVSTSPTIPTFRFTAEEDDPDAGARRPSGPLALEVQRGLLSTHQPSAATAETIRLSRICTQLLSALTSLIHLEESNLPKMHRLHCLLRLVLLAKSDASLDLLEITALGPLHSRRTAAAILSTYFPNAMGHNHIARRSAMMTYASQVARWETRDDRSYGQDGSGDHAYIPWRVSSKEGKARSRSSCTTCEGDIHGFCIRCTLCRDIQHLQCYHEAEGMAYLNVLSSEGSRQTTSQVIVKFSLIARSLQELMEDGLHRHANTAFHKQIGEHDCHAVSLFTLTLCHACQNPIWGYNAQPFACLSGCQAFYHGGCLDSIAPTPCHPSQSIPVSRLEISLDLLHAWFTQSIASLCHADVSNMSYDEIAVSYGRLWTECQIMKNGFSAGTIRLEGNNELPSDPFGIRTTLRAYEDSMNQHAEAASNASKDFARVMDLEGPLGPGYIFGDRFLIYLTALLKAPKISPILEADSSHLSAFPPSSPLPEETPDPHAPVHQTLPFDSVIRTLKEDVGIHQATISSMLLDQLQSNGLIRIEEGEEVWINFDLPLLIDSSASVEILLLAVEAMLNDLDLEMNEQALSLIVTRAWPNLLCSPYALERIGSAVIQWITSEDLVIHRLVREFATKHLKLPGLRTVADYSASRTSGPVQLYQEARNALLREYAQPWLVALHEQDSELFAHILSQHCRSPPSEDVTRSSRPTEDQTPGSAMAGLALDRLAAIVDAGVAFSCLLELLTGWLEDLGALADQDNVFKSLPRLLSRHHSPYASDTSSPTAIFTLAIETASDSISGLTKACRWMRVLAFSSVEVPWDVLKHLLQLERAAQCDSQARMDLVIAVGANPARIDPKEFAAICCNLFVMFVTEIDGFLAHQALTSAELELLERIVLLVLRSHGVSMDDMETTSFPRQTLPKPPASLSKQRRATLPMPSTFQLDPAIIMAAVRLLELRVFSKEKLVDFVWLLFTHARSVENADAVVHSTATRVIEILWPLMDIRIDRMCRSRLLLKIVSVHPEPLEQLVAADYNSQYRQQAIERSLRLLLDLTDHGISGASDGWRPRIAPLLLSFFETLIEPQNRNPGSLSITKSLMPPHRKAASTCFEEILVISNDEKRLEILARLHQLRLGFPTWQVVSWAVLDDLIAEQTATVRQLATGKVSQQHFALLDSQQARCSFVALGLDMLATGVSIDWQPVQRFQQHVAALCAVPWDQPEDGVTNLVLPALRDVLDSSDQIVHQSSDAKSRKTMLIGALFVPVVVEFNALLPDQDVATQRCILDIFLVLFFKHNTAPVELAALRTLQVVAEHIEKNDCAENRLLALIVLHTAVDRMDREVLVRVIPFVFHSISKVLGKALEQDRESGLIDPCRNLLRKSIKLFGGALLLVNVLRVDGMTHTSGDSDSCLARIILDLYPVIGSTSDTVTVPKVVTLSLTELPDVLKRGRATMEHVLSALVPYITILSEHITPEGVDAFGVFLNRIAKHVSDWTTSEFDPEPLLRVCAQILNGVASDQAIGLLSQVATFLHLCLSRFSISSPTLTELLLASSTLGRRASIEDLPRTVVHEVAGSAAHGLAVSPTTLVALLEFLIAPPVSRRDSFSLAHRTLHSRALREASSSSLNTLLRRHPTLLSPRIDPEQVIDILTKSASVILHSELHGAGSIGSSLSLLTGEAVAPQLGVFTSLLLAALDPIVDRVRKAVLTVYPILARAVAIGLRAVADCLTTQDEQGKGAEMLSAVFVVIRLTSFASTGITDVQRIALGGDRGVAIELETVWNKIWPEWYRLLSLSQDPSCTNAPLRSVTHSVFLDLLIFLGRVHSPILVSHSTALQSAMEMLVAFSERANTAGGKFARAAAALERAGLEEGTVDRKKLLDAVRADVLATERLNALRVTVPEPDKNLYMIIR